MAWPNANKNLEELSVTNTVLVTYSNNIQESHKCSTITFISLLCFLADAAVTLVKSAFLSQSGYNL